VHDFALGPVKGHAAEYWTTVALSILAPALIKGATRLAAGRNATNRTGLVDDAASAAQGAQLREHLRLSEQYGAGGVRELADGRIRYYSEVTTASKPGEMAGARLVREWDPVNGNYRTWYETLGHAGQIRQVHPYQPYSSYHYMFDEFGNYVGRR
jgi:hypothetical protein